MNAAIYARRSVEQAVAAEAKSTTRQVENALALAATKGWTVLPEHVYVDDGYSGSEFQRRPAFTRMMAALTPRAPVQVLVVSELKSIGRETAETQYTVKRLAEAGVEVFEYVHGKSLTPKDWRDKMLSAMQSGADEAHREATSQRMHEAHERLAKAGYSTGGAIYGYRSVDVFNGVDRHSRPLKSHVERVVEEEQAQVVRRIFEAYAAGLGLKAIAKRLTAEHAPAPNYAQTRNGLQPIKGWAPSTVRSILGRELYRGVAVWNRSRKCNSWGKVDPSDRPEMEWVRTPVDHLRIIPDQLWHRVASRRKEVEGRALRFEDGRISGRPAKHDVKNLLAGIATCGLCGGGLIVETSGRGGKYPQYLCARARRNGTCENKLRVRVEDVNESVLISIEAHVLTAGAVEKVVLRSERDDLSEQQERLAREHKDVAKRIARVTAAIEEGGSAAPLVARIKELEGRQAVIQQQIAGLRPVPRLAPRVVESRLNEWRRLLRSSVTQGRPSSSGS